MKSSLILRQKRRKSLGYTGALVRALFAVVLFVLFVSISAVPAFSETVHDGRLWFNFTGQGRIGAARWRWYVDTQLRNRNSGADADQYVLRPAVGYALTERSTVWVGYAYTANFQPTGGILSENRSWEQYLWSGSAGRGSITSRSRFEQRFFEGGNRVAWRVREQFRFMYPLRKHPNLSPMAWDELFFHLNSTNRNLRGFDQNRAFGGVGISVNPRTRIDVGYMNQFSRGATQNRMNHIWSTVVNLSF